MAEPSLQGFEKDLHELLDDYVNQVSVRGRAGQLERAPLVARNDLTALRRAPLLCCIPLDAGGRWRLGPIPGDLQVVVAAALCLVHPSGEVIVAAGRER